MSEEGCAVAVTLNSSFRAAIRPTISMYEHHQGKRVTASVYFEIAAKYAEKVNGTIIQHSTVSGCRGPEGQSDHVLAVYPDQPLLWERVCPGFQSVLLGSST